MKPEEFEQRLRNTPMRPAPHEWREDILRNARPAAMAARDPLRRSESATLNFSQWLANLLWPSPGAWASLAILWIGIGIFHMSTPGPAEVSAAVQVQRSPEIQRAWIEQERLAAELVGRHGGRQAGSAIPPRSQREPRASDFKEC